MRKYFNILHSNDVLWTYQDIKMIYGALKTCLEEVRQLLNK